MRNLGRRLDRIEREAFPGDVSGMHLALLLVDVAFKPALTDEQQADLSERLWRTAVGRYLTKLDRKCAA